MDSQTSKDHFKNKLSDKSQKDEKLWEFEN